MADFSPTDFNAAVQTVAGEAGNQSPDVQAAVASTILNRASLQGKAIADIASNPSVYNGADTDNARAAVPGSTAYQAIAKNIAPVFTNGPTTTATHFHSAMPEGAPAWDNGTGHKVGDLTFIDRSDLLGGQGTPPSASDRQAYFAQQNPAQGGQPSPAPAPPAPPSSMPYDNDLGVRRNPDGSIKGIEGAVSAGVEGGPTETPLLSDAPTIQAFLAKHPDDIANHLNVPSSAERSAYFGPLPAQAQTPGQAAAAQDATGLQSAITAFGQILTRGSPHFGGSPTGQGADLIQPFVHGASQGLSDEAMGGMFGVGAGLRNAALNAFGQPIPYSMADASQAMTQANRNALNADAQAHPIATPAAEILGSVAPWIAGGESLAPAKAITEAATPGARLMQYAGSIGKGAVKGAAVGAPAGAINAFGNADGDLGDRMAAAGHGAAFGAAGGALLGAAAPAMAPAIKGAVNAIAPEATAAGGALATGVKNAFGNLAGKPGETSMADYWAAKSPSVQGVANATAAPDAAAMAEPTEHETRAAQARVQQMMALAGKHTDDLRAVPDGLGHTTAEAIGSQTVNHLASLARRAGTTPDLAAAQIAERNQQIGEGVMQDFAEASGVHPDQARVLNEDVVNTIQKEETTPAYKVALDVEHPRPVMSPALAKLQDDPDVQTALAAAQRLVAKTGRPPTMAGFKIDPDTGAKVTGADGQPVLEQHPTPETWDMAKKLVDKLIVRDISGKSVDSGIEGVKNIFLEKASQDLSGALKEAMPGYDKALASASDKISRREAFKLGVKDFFSGKASPADWKAARSNMSPDELEAHTAGAAAALFNKVDNGNLTAKALGTPAMKSKLQSMFSGNADDFIDKFEQRMRLKATGNRIAPGPGSQTTPLLEAGKETDAQDAFGNAVKEGIHAIGSPKTFLLKQGMKAGVQNLLGDTAANISETPGFRNAYGRILLQSPRATADELRAEPGISPKMLSRPLTPSGAIAGYVGGQSARPSQ